MLFSSPPINVNGTKATRIDLFSFSTPEMRAFHMTWLAFFVCFFAWFAAAPLMPLIRTEFNLNKDQIANINIAAVAVTIIFRMLVGPLCDKYGPRRTYTWLLAVGSIPVFGLALVHSYQAFLFFRLCIGAIGASFVITQYHTSVMFAPNVVGTANATVGGWGNAGGGATQSLMPLIVTAVVTLGVEKTLGWRVAMIVPGVAMLVTAVLYATLTQDTPKGDLIDLRAQGVSIDASKKSGLAVFAQACRNYRVWMLAATYGACFGIELFIHTVAVTYYVDKFQLTLASAGMAAGIFGGLALFARALGGITSDKIATSRGLDGRTKLLFGCMVLEGLGLIMFSKAPSVTTAILSMTFFGLFTHMACGATYALVPFLDRKALGGVTGIIGAGGNVGAVAAGFVAKAAGSPQDTFMILGIAVLVISLCALAVRFSAAHKSSEQELLNEALAERARQAPLTPLVPAMG